MRQLPAPVNFFFVGTISLVVEWHSQATTLTRAWSNDQYTHILLIVPIAITLVYQDWPVGFRAEPHLGLGSILLSLAVLAAAYSRFRPADLTTDVQLSIDMLALVTWWIGAFVLFFGVRAARSLIFTLCFLFWMVPIPAFALQKIVECLQQGSAVATWFLFSAVGVPVLRSGVLVSISGLTVEVAKECSSIRSSLMLLVTTMVLAHVLLRTSWRKALLILLVVPLSVAKNGLRIFTLAMLGTRVDRSFLSGRLHHDGGIVFFLLALLVIGMLLGVLRKGERAMAKGEGIRTVANQIPRLVADASTQ